MGTIVVEYKVIECEDTCDITEVVNDEISQGWQPYGPLLHADSSHYRWPLFIQPLVRYGATHDTYQA